MSHEGLAGVQEDFAAFRNHPLDRQVLPNVFCLTDFIVHYPAWEEISQPEPGVFLLDGQLEKVVLYMAAAARLLCAKGGKTLKCPEGREVGEDGRMAEMAELTCLIREKTTMTFVKDWKSFMERFWLKAERMNLRFGDWMIRRGRKWKEGIILE